MSRARTMLVVRLSIVLMFLAVVGVFTLVDRHEHQRLVTLATLALNEHFCDGQSTDHAVPLQAITAAVVVAVVVPVRELPPARVAVSSQGRMLCWEDSGIGHMLLTDE